MKTEEQNFSPEWNALELKRLMGLKSLERASILKFIS